MRTYKNIVAVMLMAAGVAWGDMPKVGAAPVMQGLSLPTSMGTLQQHWQRGRLVTASDTPLAATTKSWSAIKGTFLCVPAWASFMRISCYADGDGTGTGDPNGGSFAWKLFVCDQFSSAQLVGTGTWAIGELALSHDPDPADGKETLLTYGITDPNSSKWGELPVETADGWSAISELGATDGLGELRVDIAGSSGIWLEVTSLTNITNLNILFKGY